VPAAFASHRILLPSSLTMGSAARVVARYSISQVSWCAPPELTRSVPSTGRLMMRHWESPGIIELSNLQRDECTVRGQPWRHLPRRETICTDEFRSIAQLLDSAVGTAPCSVHWFHPAKPMSEKGPGRASKPVRLRSSTCIPVHPQQLRQRGRQVGSGPTADSCTAANEVCGCTAIRSPRRRSFA
jgi:hypothetical protein